MKVSEDNLSVEMRGVDDEYYIVTVKDFKDYEECSVSGVTNMYHISKVAMITGLYHEKIKLIMENYYFLHRLFVEDDDGAC